MPSPSVSGRACRATAAVAALALAAACGDLPADPRTAVAAAPPPPTTAGGPTLGSLLRLNTSTDAACDTSRGGFRGGRVAAVGARAIVVADTLNPPGGFTDADYTNFAAAFDTLAYPVDVRHFGQPTDLDRNGRVIVFFTSAVNALTPRGADFVVGGFFWNRDLFPKGGARGCPGSNDGELFYMLAPDPGGAVNGNARSREYVLRSSVGVLAHEFQHLISASRRLYVLNTADFDEDVWLNEGLSHAAEELVFYKAAGLAPRARLTLGALRASPLALTSLNAYGVQNIGRLSDYLTSTEQRSPYATDDSLGTRGATWSFLRYAADRAAAAGAPSDSALFYRLVNSARTGLPNLEAALAGATGAPVSLPDWFRDWAAANYADGLATGLDARFTHRSWAFREVLPGLSSNAGRYPLTTRDLADAQPQTAALVGGGTAYLRFAVPAGGRATVGVRQAGAATLPPNVRLALVAGATVTTYDPGTNSVTTAGGAGAAATYALVAFNADSSPRARTTITVEASGVAPLVAERAAAYAGPTLARLAEGAAGPPITDAPLAARLRVLGRAELAGRVDAARTAYAARGAAAPK